MRMSELGQKSKPGERGEACFSFYFGTVEPRYNETLYNEVLGITNEIFCHSYSIMYGKKNLDITKPRFSERNRGSTVIKR